MRKTQGYRLHLAVPAMLAALACGGSTDAPSQQSGSTALFASSISISATPQTIVQGASAQLLAQFARGTGTISPGIGRVSSGVPVTVSPRSTTTYTLSVTWGWLTASRRVTVTVAGAPVSPGAPIAIYGDSLAGGWQDWSWVSHNLANTAPVSSGTNSIAVYYGPWTGLSFDLPGSVSTAGAGTLEFDAHGGVTSNPEIHAIAQFGGTWGPEVSVAPYCGGGAIPAGAFTHCAVPLDVLGVANTSFERIALKEGRGLRLPAMYFDQISIVPEAVAPPPAIQSFTASPQSITAGDSATLFATFSGGTGSIDNGVGPIASGGSVTVTPLASTTYTLTVTDGAGHTATQSTVVTVTAVVSPPAIQNFNASPSTIAVGSRATLSATYSGGTGSIDNGVGAIASGGSATVAPSATTTYTLTVTAPSGSTAAQSTTVTVTVTAPEISVTISPKLASVWTGGVARFSAMVSGTTGGQSTAVTWSVQEPEGGTVDSSGQYTAPAAAGTYHVVATSVEDPSKSDAAAVTVTTSALIAADRTTVWNPGLNSVGGIPNRSTICKSLAPSGNDDTAAIQAALDSCPANQVVQLSAGNFRISDPGLNFRTSNITLRGAGPGVTVLTQRPTAQYGVIAMGTQWYEWMSPKAFTTDAVKEANSVTVANTTGLTVGQLVHVNETYDSSLIYFNPSQQNGDYQGWGEGRQGPQAASRPVGQAMEIASISGNTVTFTTGFHQTYRVNHSAHLVQISDGAKVVATTKWSGIEELTVENGSGGDGGGNIRVFASSHCWAKHIESRNQNAGAAFAFDGSFQCELRDSYLHSAQDPNPGGAGYGIVFDSYTADSLAENNIVWNFNKVSAFRSSGGGNVFAYNYCEDMYGQGYPTIVEVGINASHMAGSHHELFEGNQGPNFDSDSYWGSQMYITAFRNHLTMMRRNISGVAALGNGVLANLRDENNKRGIGLTVYQKWYSFVGNVIGVPNGYLQTPAIGFAYPATFGPGPQGTTFRYEWLGGAFGTDTSPTYTPIWQIGYDGSNWFTTQESTSQATVQRDGNYDYFTRQVHWHGIGGTGQNNGLTAPSGVALPDSLYLTARPAFFGSSPWPWVDGSNASNPLPGILPARMRFDAGTPNQP